MKTKELKKEIEKKHRDIMAAQDQLKNEAGIIATKINSNDYIWLLLPVVAFIIGMRIEHNISHKQKLNGQEKKLREGWITSFTRFVLLELTK